MSNHPADPLVAPVGSEADAQTARQTQPIDAELPPPLPAPVVGIGASAGGLADIVLDAADRTRAAVERARTDAELKESLHQLTIALDAARMGTFDWNPETDRIAATSTSLELLGLLPGTALPTSQALFQIVHPEDVDRYREIFLRAGQRGDPYFTEYRVIRPRDGRVIWMEERGTSTLDSLTGKLHTRGVHWDITQRKLAETRRRESDQRLEALAQLVPDLLWEADASGQSVWYNQGWYDYTGQTLEQSLGYGWMAAIHPDDRERSRSAFQAGIESGQRIRHEHRIRRRDGQYRWFLVQAAPMRDDQGAIVRWFGAVSDIHEQRVALDALRASESNFRALSDLVPDLLWRFDPHTNLGWVNQRWTEYTGQPGGTQDALAWLGILHPDDRAYARQSFGAMINSGQALRTERRLRRHNGEYRWFLVQMVPVHDESGAVTTWFGTATDVHDQRAALDALAVAEERSRMLIEDVQDHAIFLLDSEGRVASWNAGAERITGYSTEQVLGQTTDLCLTPEDRAAKLGSKNVEMAREKGRCSTEHWQVRKDGSRYWAWTVTTALRGTDGSLRGFSRLVRDDTLRREAEEARKLLASIVQTSTDAILSYTLGGQIISWNPAAERLLGYSTAEAKQMNLAELAPPELQAERNEFVERLSRGPVLQHEAVLLAKSGQRLETSITAATVSADGEPIAAAIVHDIRQRKRAEEALRASKVAAEEANRIKDEFLATLSHELRTPLSAILLWSKLLQSSELADTGQLREGLNAIRTSAEAQRELIEDLLDMSRITVGSLRLQVRDVDLTTVFRDALDAIHPAADAKGVTVSASLEEHLGVVRVDPDRVRQIVWNLLTNAVKFTPPGGEVAVNLSRSNKAIEIGVTDSGKGIDPKFLPHVFERFRQADTSHGRTAGGMGLGLAIVKQLVELHGGTIVAESPGLDRGATFTVRLPLPKARARTAARRTQISAAAKEDAGEAALAGRTVLLIEDDAETRGAVATLLRRAGMKVTELDTGATALDTFERLRPDLLISDIGLPAEDGYSLIRRIRRLESKSKRRPVPAVALTAFARETDHRTAMEAGFQRHLGKPIEREVLLVTLVDLLARR